MFWKIQREIKILQGDGIVLKAQIARQEKIIHNHDEAIRIQDEMSSSPQSCW